MTQLLAVIRIAAAALVIAVSLPFLIAAGFLRLRWKGVYLASWIVRLTTLCYLFIFNVRLTCPEPERLRRHRGLIVANHVSYLDIIMLTAIHPVRFLSAMEVKERPVIGWLAAAAGSVFVERSDLRSKRNAVVSIVEQYQSEPEPPIGIFPEGRLGTGDRVFPFQLGVFKMAIRNDIPYLVCAIRYDRPDIAVWHGRRGESMLAALWRSASFRGPLHAMVIPIE